MRHLHRAALLQGGVTLTDGELLECYIARRDEAAFGALVRRHGPMVLGVCRRVLGNVHDAEDAFQATFLVLVRKAASIVPRAMVGNWLYGVAHNTALKAKAMNSKRRAREQQAALRRRPDASTDVWQQLQPLLDEELSRLPNKYRVPIILCELEGKPIKEAARHLGWPQGTVASRLARGRALLSRRLLGRGLTLSSGAVAAALAQNAATAGLPGPLLVSTVQAASVFAVGQAAAGAIPAKVAVLTEGVLKAMLMTKLKIAAAVLLAVGLVAIGTGVLTSGQLVARQPGAGAAEQPEADDEQAAAATEVGQPTDPAPLARNQAESRLNLKKLAFAMRNYHDTHGHFPAPAIYSREGGMGGFAGKMGGGMGMKGGGMGMRGGGMGGMMGGMGGMGSEMGRPPAGMMGMQGGSGAGMMGMKGGSPAGIMGISGGSGAGMMGGAGGKGMGAGPMPQAAGQGGKALLSWRVALLPFLGEQDLYKQFKLHEPWDSPRNKKLLKRMPKVYAAPGLANRQPGSTFYQVFVGEHAAFEKHRTMGMADFPDGTANTLLIVEAGSAVPWTKPEDLHYAADEPIPELGGLFAGIFNAAFADGSVYALTKKYDADTLRKAITRDDGLPTDLDPLKTPTSRREAKLRQRNEHLKQELGHERARLQSLRREMEVLQEITDDAGTRRLKEENAKLEDLLRRSREEAEQLRKEIERLKQRSENRQREEERN
jgi:RNA polymerase sigma factor (sigma-70 family)